MIIFIGFDAQNQIIIESRDKVNKFDKGIFLKVSHKQNLEIENFLNLKSFDLSEYHLIDHYNASLFDELFSLELNDLVKKIHFFFTANESNEDYTLMREYFSKKIETLEHISSCFEICIIIIAQINFNLKFEKNICFNLPGGAGKTHCIDWLQKLFESKILVSTPTAKAATHYSEKIVKTNHSTFKLDPNELKKSKCNVCESILIFDEASMLSLDVYNSLKNIFEEKIVYFVGDFAQLNPVLSKNILKCNLKIINSTDDIFLPRYESKTYVRLLNIVRNKILKPYLLVDMNELECLLKKFKTKSNVKIYTKFIKNSIEEIKHNRANNESIKNLQPLVTSNNFTSTFINNKVLDGFNENFLSSSIFVSKKEWETNRTMIEKKIFNNDLILLGDSKITVGSKVICKKNINSSLYNGLTGLIVHIDRADTSITDVIKLEKKINSKRIIVRYICLYEKSKFNIVIRIKTFETNKLIEMRANTLANDLKVFYLRPYYCVTLYQMQGSTVKNGELCALDDVLDKNILKNFYVLISRCKNFKYILLSDSIIKKIIKKFLD